MTRLFTSSIAGALLLAAGSMFDGAGSARADIFVLASEGQIQGEVVPSPDTPQDRMVIRTASGGEIIVEKNQIKEIKPQSAAQLEYEKIRPTYPDTVAGQWQLAEWCREHSLGKERQAHLERIIVLDPNHKQARGVLGYSFIDGRWIRPDDLMKERGYVMYKGVPRLPQEIELIERREREKVAEQAWFGKLKRWRASLDNRPDQGEELRDQLLSSLDPAAVPAITQMLGNESVRRVKILLIDALVQLGSAGSLSTVVKITLDDPDEEVRLSALDSLAKTKHPELVSVYVKALRSSDNTRVNRAAFCLGKIGDKSAISPLIEALRTRHKFIEGSGTPGQMSTTFGSGGGMSGGGMSVGGGPKEVKVWIENQEVLRVLVGLADVNFEFNQQAWKNWYASQRKPVTVDARRGN